MISIVRTIPCQVTKEKIQTKPNLNMISIVRLQDMMKVRNFCMLFKNDITCEWLNTRSREQRTNCVGDANATVALNEALERKSLEKEQIVWVMPTQL